MLRKLITGFIVMVAAHSLAIAGLDNVYAASALGLKVSADKHTSSLGEAVYFNCVPYGGNAPYTYSWNFDDVETYTAGFATNSSPSHKFNHLGEHHVAVDVTDSSGVTASAVIIVDVRIDPDTPTINVTTDCGGNNLDKTGKSDVGGKLSNCINDNYSSNGLRLYFPAGVYRFNDRDSGGYQIGFGLSEEKLAFVGDGPSKTILSFYNDSTSTAKTHGDFFRANTSNAAWWLWKNMTLQLDLSARGNSPDDFTRRQFLLSGTDNNSIRRLCMFEDVHIKNFTSVVYWGAYLTMKRCNVTNFGRGKDQDSDSKPYEAAVDYGDESLIRHTYWGDGARGESGELGHSHIFYPQNAQFTYVVENFANLENSAEAKLAAQLKKAMRDSEFSGNLIMNGKGIQWGHNDYIAERLASNNNRLKNIYSDSLVFINTLNAEAKNNFFNGASEPRVEAQNGTGSCDEATNCRSENITIKNNEYGSGASYTVFRQINVSGTLKNIADTGGKNTGNRYVATDPAGWYDTGGYIDPGVFEFDPPTNCSVSVSGSGDTVTLSLAASDSGSGMGSAARFPFRKGGVMQFSNDGQTWSESRPYAQSATWTLSGGSRVYARFRDRDGNWSDVVSSDGTVGEPVNVESPKNLRIVSMQ